MMPVWAVATVTLRAAFRLRVVRVLGLLLLAAVGWLPFLLKHNGTARMFTQVSLSYSLLAVLLLLGAATLWLACHTMARDLESGQLQPTLVKPAARWQVWLGKWLGILVLDAVLLTVAGGGVYGLLHWRAARLAPAEQQRLREEVLVARGSVTEPLTEFHREVEAVLAKRRRQPAYANFTEAQLREGTAAAVRGAMENVAPGYQRVWRFDLGWRARQLRDQPLFLRVKSLAAHAAEGGGARTEWTFGVPERGAFARLPVTLAPATVHTLRVPAGLIGADGSLTVTCANRSETTLVIPLGHGAELRFKEDGFLLNYARGLLVVFFWLALLAAVGLCAGSFLSFPLAALFSLALLLTANSRGTFVEAVSDGTVFGEDHETGVATSPTLDRLALPVMQGLGWVTTLVSSFSPIESVSTGRSVGWGEVARALGQIVLLVGGAVAGLGVWLLHRREIATAQTASS